MNSMSIAQLLKSSEKRIEDILMAYRLCLLYSSNPYLPLHIKEDGLSWLPCYCDLIITEMRLVQSILLEHLGREEGAPCHE